MTTHHIGTAAQVDVVRVRRLTRELLAALGEDPDRPGLADTPDRVARWWVEFLDYDPGSTDTAFEIHHTDQMVGVSGIRAWSLCEHHLLPFAVDVSVGYIADGSVLGLSKFARIVHQHAHRLQLQERFTNDVADHVQAVVGSPSVAVLAHGRHLCLEVRGIRTPATMTTSVMRGAFRDTPSARAEFLAITRTG